MPHDAVPRNGRINGSGVPGWAVALALAIFFSAAAAVLAAATGAFLILLPVSVVLALGCGLYAMIAARRRRFDFELPSRRFGAIRDARALRRQSRGAGGLP